MMRATAVILGFNHLTLAVRDLEASCRFYQELLGFRLAARWPRGAYLEAGGLWLALSLAAGEAGRPTGDESHIAFSVSAASFSGLAGKLRQAEVEEWRENRSEGPSIYILDPDGHRLELHVGDLDSRLDDLVRRGDPGVEVFPRLTPDSAIRHQKLGDQTLRRADLDADPLAQCRAWLREATAAGEPDPYAMTLASVSEDGGPSTRTVALKGIDHRGFLFTSPYDGPKARELAGDPRASLVLYWPRCHRQVRALGVATRLDPEESERLFRGRPRASQLALLVARPSEPIAGRGALEERFSALEEAHQGREIPMPKWGGYVLAPSIVELWQGHTGRLHDRFRYQRDPHRRWHLQRLAP